MRTFAPSFDTFYEFSRPGSHAVTADAPRIGEARFAAPGSSARADSPHGSGLERIGAEVTPAAHDFGTIRIYPIKPRPSITAGALHDIPIVGGPEEEAIDQPPAGGSPAGPGGPAGPAPTADSCEQPRSMNKLTSGAFLGGLTMDSYYPDLTGRGYYDHPGTAGTFDTGSRVGANIQLYGVIPSPCEPSRFRLEQTVTRTRFRINGVVHPEEGRTFDDIAKSGRDASRPPFRQEFLGGGDAPLGYIISMADPPSTGYSSSSNIEHDRDFVTSLAGPGGRQSVSWSLSSRTSGGTVTRNVLT
jgi:hypothetical protein